MLTDDRTQMPKLGKAFEKASAKLVNCNGCTKCCEKGIAYVLPEEKQLLETTGVPLIEIDGVYFIKRKKDGACAMLDNENKQCSIYKDRPLCCRAFPLDVFSRRGRLEWGIYNYCPTDRIVSTVDDEALEVDYEVASYLASSIEKHLTPDILRFLEEEDLVVEQSELLDEHRNDFVILGPVNNKVK